MTKKLWIKLFLGIAAIFVAFVVIISIANSALLSEFFKFKEERILLENSRKLSDLDVGNPDAVTARISEVRDKYNFDIEIYEKNGRVLYTTVGRQMMDFIHSGFDRPGFAMNHEQMETQKSKTTDDGMIVKKGKKVYHKITLE